MLSVISLTIGLADSAIHCVDRYTYNVMDIAQEVESNSSKLTGHHTEVSTLAADAQTELDASESMLEQAKSQIKLKEADIKQKTADVESKQQRKKQLEDEIAEKQAQGKVARRERKSRKEDSLLGLVIPALCSNRRSVADGQ